MNEKDPTPVLDYRGKSAPFVTRAPDRGLALVLCAPGFVCWICFLIPESENLFRVGLLIWPVAVLTAIVSLFKYVRFSKRAFPWCVVLNLAINISGLIFSGIILHSLSPANLP
jgi:hypothetical protein